jgi:hypothetical protein
VSHYFAHVTDKGPERHNRHPFAIGVLQAPDNFMPVGLAVQTRRTEDGMALYRLSVDGRGLTGRWMVVDRRIVADEGAAA